MLGMNIPKRPAGTPPKKSLLSWLSVNFPLPPFLQGTVLSNKIVFLVSVCRKDGSLRSTHDWQRKQNKELGACFAYGSHGIIPAPQEQDQGIMLAAPHNPDPRGEGKKLRFNYYTYVLAENTINTLRGFGTWQKEVMSLAIKEIIKVTSLLSLDIFAVPVETAMRTEICSVHIHKDMSHKV